MGNGIGMAEGMRGIAEDIMGSYNLRIKTLGDIVVDTRDLMTGTRKDIRRFAHERRRMGREQADNLAGFVHGLTKFVEGMMKGFKDDHNQMGETQAKELAGFMKDLTKDVGSMLNVFHREHAEMTDELKGDLAKEIKYIETEVKHIEAFARKRLREFQESHSEMSDELKKSLDRYAGDLSKGMRKVLGEYRSDRKKAEQIWHSMTSLLAKSRKNGVMPRLEAGEKVTTVKDFANKK